MGSEMQVNIFSILSLGKDRSYFVPADDMTLGDVIGFHCFIAYYVRSLTFKFLNYTVGNKYNNPLDARNYRLSVPREINVVSDKLKLVADINFTRKLLSIYINNHM